MLNYGIAYADEWVGLDGDGEVPLLQSGMHYETFDVDSYNRVDGGVAPTDLFFDSQSAWTFSLPGDKGISEVIMNIPVRTADVVFVVVGATDGNGNVNLNGGYQMTYFVNTSLYPNVAIKIVRPTGNAKVPGISAEWVLEEPTIDGSISNPLLTLFMPWNGQRVGDKSRHLNDCLCDRSHAQRSTTSPKPFHCLLVELGWRCWTALHRRTFSHEQ